MKKYCTTNKNKAFIILGTVLLAFLILSISLVIQILVNNKYKITENQYKIEIFFNGIDYLDNIMKAEIKIIEELINNEKIGNTESYFDKNLNDEKIFLLTNFNERISKGGYRIYSDNKNKNYYQTLDEQIKKSYPKSVTIYYEKKIFFYNKKILLRAKIDYTTDFLKKPENLKNGILKGIEIIEND